MFLQPIDLTTALRPSLLPDETLLFVQDAVGLYGGKTKLADYQNGQAYLTSHRACYVDNERPRERAVAISLKEVERSEFSAGFLKSSPKVTIYSKSSKFVSSSWNSAAPGPVGPSSNASDSHYNRSLNRPAPQARPLINATWVCPICSFSNPVAANFDPATANASTPLAPCLACGIKPPLTLVVKAAVGSLSQRGLTERGDEGSTDRFSRSFNESNSSDPSTFQCPRCTFHNHPSLMTCEICGASLVSGSSRTLGNIRNDASRAESPAAGPGSGAAVTDAHDEIKFSFRMGGEKVFQERLKAALVQKKWLLQGAPTITATDAAVVSRKNASPASNIGITGLERRGLEQRKNNELVIGNAFEDLAALMASAKEIIALAEQFASNTNSKNGGKDTASEPLAATDSEPDPAALLSQLNLATTKDMLSSPGGSSSNLYLTELARSLAEFLTDDARGVLRKSGGVISLVDLWAIFNRARGGLELVSPTDFAAAANLFEKLYLPIRLRNFKSGLLVVQERSRTDEKTIMSIRSWLETLRRNSVALDEGSKLHHWGRGVTAQETAEQFGWSIGIATEELEMAEEYGTLCRENALEGIRFWENWLVPTSR